MKCKNCGANLPANAKFCDVCGAPVIRKSFAEREKANAKKRKESAKKQKIFIIAAALGVVLFLALLWYLFYPKIIQFDPNIDRMKVRVSVEEFEKIEIGMTYDEVCEIVGGRGKLEEVFGGAVNGAIYYIWAGEAHKKTNFHSSLTVSIDNRSKKVDWIKADNILNADKIKKVDGDTYTWDDARTVVKDIENPPIKDDMTYEEVAKVFGRDGLLQETTHIKSLMKDDEYQEQYFWDLVPEDPEDYESQSMYLWFYNGKLTHYDRYNN